MRYIGAHVSTGGGLWHSPDNAVAIGANAFALFLKNQRQWEAPPLNKTEISAFQEHLAASGIDPAHVLPHDSYLINVASPEADKRANSLKALIAEAERAQQLGLKMVNFHPGSHLGQISEEEGLNNVAAALNELHKKVGDVCMVIECTAGQGTNLGYTFKHLGYIIDKVQDKERVAVCLDTCHAMAAGYDLVTAAGYEETWQIFERDIGLKYLKAFHLNDSKNPRGSRKDRHESLGAGYLGLEPFKRLMADERFKEATFILETPNPDLWASEIATLRSFASA